MFFIAFFLKYFNGNSQDSKIKFGMYLDTYYSFDVSKPTTNRLYVTQYDRHNEFNLGHALVTGSYTGVKTRANLGLQIGTYPANNYAAEPEKLYQLIHEAYAGYQLFENGWLDVGVFGGHFGYESALAMDRELYSPAFATEYTPYYQSGVRYSHDLSTRTQFRVVLLNGWQNIAETNDAKSFGIGIDHQLSERVSVSYGNYYGNESTLKGEEIMRFHNNLIINTQPTEKFSLIGVADFTTQSNSLSDALFLTIISNYQFSENWSTAARYEFVQDNGEILISSLTGDFEMNIFTLAINHNASKNAALKFEGKYYQGNQNNFEGENGVGKTNFVFNAGIIIRMSE